MSDAPLQRQLDDLADDVVRRGFDEGGEEFDVWYSDMGSHRTRLQTSDFAARAVFVRELVALARFRRREFDERALET